MNSGGYYFNAPSREALYYHMHKLTYGDSWEYDYETFVAYDAINRTEEGKQHPFRSDVGKRMEPIFDIDD